MTTQQRPPSRPRVRGYRFGVHWIAANDNSGSDDGLDEISGYISTALLADLFGRLTKDVAADIHAERVRIDLAEERRRVEELERGEA